MHPPHGARRFAVALGVLVLVNAISFLFGPEGMEFGLAGVSVLPFAALAGLAYVGEDEGWARTLALISGALIAVLASVVFLSQATELLALTRARGQGQAAQTQTSLMSVVMFLGLGLAALALLAPVRRMAARILPLDPGRFVHAMALALTISLTVSALAPLLVLGEPILTAMITAQEKAGTEAASGPLHAALYPLSWLIPMSILAVGYGIRRTFRQSLRRLGLTRVTVRQIFVSLVVAAMLVLMVALLAYAIEVVWTWAGWPRTNEDALHELISDFLTPVGAIVLGVSAGLGEELVVRGVLQPRLGLVAPNLLFTALHASQYHWDFLLVIFAVGMVFGLVRKHGNTTMSAIVHGVYDLLIILLTL